MLIRWLACATDETKLLLSPSAKGPWNPCSVPRLVYQGLSTGHDWPFKKAIVDLPIRMKGNLKRTSGNSLTPFGALSKDISAASQTLLTEVELRLWRRLYGGGGCPKFGGGVCSPPSPLPGPSADLQKLYHYEIRGIVNFWFSSYLKLRSQTTNIGPNISEKAPSDCSVPQGSVLRPLLLGCI